jgi:hypothetical protein
MPALIKDAAQEANIPRTYVMSPPEFFMPGVVGTVSFCNALNGLHNGKIPVSAQRLSVTV